MSGLWTPGDLSAANLGNIEGSKYLWAIIDPSGNSRLGFVRTENVISEAFNPGNGWQNVDF